MNRLKTVIAPSILSADFIHLQRDCQEVLAFGADSLHIDIMDGNFVPNLTVGPLVINSLRKCFPTAHLDCHLMVVKPQLYLEHLSKAKVNYFTFHYEAMAEQKIPEFNQSIKNKHIDMKIGISIKPKTQPPQILQTLYSNKLLDKILIMTVQPGFAGQKLIEQTIQKVKYYRSRLPDIDIQVDGGINVQNIGRLAESGANCFVAGSSIFGADNRGKVVREMKQAIQKVYENEDIR